MQKDVAELFKSILQLLLQLLICIGLVAFIIAAIGAILKLF